MVLNGIFFVNHCFFMHIFDKLPMKNPFRPAITLFTQHLLAIFGVYRVLKTDVNIFSVLGTSSHNTTPREKEKIFVCRRDGSFVLYCLLEDYSSEA